MPTFEFRGRVHPEARPLTIHYQPTFKRTAVEGGPETVLSFYVVDGAVTVKVRVEEYSDAEATDLHLPALDYARSLVEVAGFAQGVPFAVEFNEVVRPDGTAYPVILADKRLGQLCNVVTADSYEALADILMLEHSVGLALSDLLMCLSKPHYAPIACGRVADSLARILTGGHGPKEWEQMRQTLRVDKAYVKLLTDASIPHRHGDRVPVSGPENSELATRAWTLMNRYLAFRLRGGEPLSEDEFPMLEG